MMHDDSLSQGFSNFQSHTGQKLHPVPEDSVSFRIDGDIPPPGQGRSSVHSWISFSHHIIASLGLDPTVSFSIKWTPSDFGLRGFAKATIMTEDAGAQGDERRSGISKRPLSRNISPEQRHTPNGPANGTRTHAAYSSTVTLSPNSQTATTTPYGRQLRI